MNRHASRLSATEPVCVLKRFAEFLLVVFVGVSLTFFITHLTSIDPVEQMIAGMTAMGQIDPQSVALMREALREFDGAGGPLVGQYLTYSGRTLEWAPPAGHDQAASLTGSRTYCISYCSGLRQPSDE